jgi:hypothetical protein
VSNETFNDNRCGVDVRIADSFMLNEQDFASIAFRDDKIGYLAASRGLSLPCRPVDLVGALS